MEPFLIICGAVKYYCANQEELDKKLLQLASQGILKVQVYRSEVIDVVKFRELFRRTYKRKVAKPKAVLESNNKSGAMHHWQAYYMKRWLEVGR